MKEMWSIDEEIQKLTSDLKKTEQITQRELLERRIDSLYAEFLKYFFEYRFHHHRLVSS